MVCQSKRKKRRLRILYKKRRKVQRSIFLKRENERFSILRILTPRIQALSLMQSDGYQNGREVGTKNMLKRKDYT